MGHHPHGESSQKADREVEDAPALTRVEEILGAARWVVETIERRPEPTGEVGDDGGQQGADEATEQSCPLGCTHSGARRRSGFGSLRALESSPLNGPISIRRGPRSPRERPPA